jgi:WD40 repeat protein
VPAAAVAPASAAPSLIPAAALAIQPSHRLVGHSNDVKAVAVLRDGRVASASVDTTVRVWNTTTAGQDVKIEVKTVPYALLALSGGGLAVACGDHSVQVSQRMCSVGGGGGGDRLG